ncbi:MAG: GAF domain-containing protein [Actinomycetota bacterium]|nr:GAF domain-containing protein [Actinomycetota bacterium]
MSRKLLTIGLLAVVIAALWMGISSHSWVWGVVATACAVTLADITLVAMSKQLPVSVREEIIPPTVPVVRPRIEPQDPHGLVTAILDQLSEHGVVAVTLWAAHESTGTARPFASVGPFASGTAPASLAGTPVGHAIDSGATCTERISAISDGERRGQLWTIAMPLGEASVDGAVSVDVVAEGPHSEAIHETLEHYGVDLSTAIALHELKDRERSTRALLDSVTALSRVLRPEELLNDALAAALRFSDGESGSIMLLDDQYVLRIHASKGLSREVVDSTRVLKGEGISGWVLSSGKPLLIEDAPQTRSSSARRLVRSALSVPMADDEGIVGVLNVGSHALPARFTERHMEDLGLFATHVAIAWRNASAVGAAEQLMFDSLKTLALAMETKDPYTMGGTERLVEYVRMLARAIDLSPQEVRSVEIAALLHDVGMEAAGGTPRGRRAGLTTLDHGLIQMHPAVAADLLRDAPTLAAVAPIVYHHHEHYDGTGYVEGLKGEDIPIGARILAVCDAYVAMTSARPYRTAMDSRRALRELTENAGTQFDPRIVESFVDSMSTGSDRVPRFEG